MKGYLVIFIVLLVVLGCNDSEPKQVAFYYKNSICGYDVQGVAFQDSIDRDYCNIILTFRNKVTNKSFSVNGGKRSTLYYIPKDGQDSIYLSYEETNTPAPNIYLTASTESFCFMDLDFDGIKELMTDLKPNIGQYGVGVFNTIYKIKADSLIDVTSQFRIKSRVFNVIEQNYFGINLGAKEVITWDKGGYYMGIFTIYKYNSRTSEYKLNRYVGFYPGYDDGINISIISPANDTLNHFVLSQDEFDSQIWEY